MRRHRGLIDTVADFGFFVLRNLKADIDRMKAEQEQEKRKEGSIDAEYRIVDTKP